MGNHFPFSLVFVFMCLFGNLSHFLSSQGPFAVLQGVCWTPSLFSRPLRGLDYFELVERQQPADLGAPLWGATIKLRISDSHLVMVSISTVYHMSQVASRWHGGLQKKSQDKIPNWYHLQKKPRKSPQNNTVQGSCLRLFSLPVKDLKG